MIVAGVFGALTAKPTILFTQALPGAIALLLVLLAVRGKNDGTAQPARAQ